MRCFYHHEKETVGQCKSCGKGVCAECAVDLGKGLACHGRCEEQVRALIELIDRNIELSKTWAPKLELAPPAPPVHFPSESYDFVVAQLSSQIRSSERVRWISGVLYLLVGMALVAAGVVHGLFLLDIVGFIFVVFGTIAFFQAQRMRRQPKSSETITR
jgi:hypothetical protein